MSGQRRPPPDLEVGRRRTRLRAPVWAVAGCAAVAMVAAMAGKLQGELLVAVCLAVVVVGDLVAARANAGDAIPELTFAGDGEVGVPTGATVRVQGSRGPVWVRVGWWQPRWFALEAEANGWVALTPRGRGTLRWVDIDVAARGPLGIWQVGRRCRVRPPRVPAVGPRLHPHEVDFPAQYTRPFGETVLTRGADDLTRGIRDYRPGDSRKLVHWPATAHHGRLLVRETETLGTIRVRIALETPSAGFASEVALGRAGWLVLDCLAKGWEVELVTTEWVAPPTEPDLPPSPFGGPPSCSLVQDAAINSSPMWSVSASPYWSWTWSRATPVRTRVEDVRSTHDLVHRLASVAAGELEFSPSRLRTRVVSPRGDRWL